MTIRFALCALMAGLGSYALGSLVASTGSVSHEVANAASVGLFVLVFAVVLKKSSGDN